MSVQVHKIIFNGVELPDIFFTYKEAKEHLKSLIESSCAGQGRVYTTTLDS